MDLVSSVREEMEASIPSILRLTAVISCSIRSIVAGRGTSLLPRLAALLRPRETLLRLRGTAGPVCGNTQRVLLAPLRSVPLGPVLLRSRRSGEAGLLARPTLAGPRRMPRRDSSPGAVLVVPVALRPRVSPSGSDSSPSILRIWSRRHLRHWSLRKPPDGYGLTGDVAVNSKHWSSIKQYKEKCILESNPGLSALFRYDEWPYGFIK
ncbi:hypothetical protein NDU88_008235 [Pleurodeles waltl]|uniref:Uncharacterized protein n=1 Tax=Pleurodeles waltl TaxID=8319 RepID=A0AAV7NYB5_PLEWA|nr:hypothetical protein NDU88_008235 [Pleurodeles waltl]